MSEREVTHTGMVATQRLGPGRPVQAKVVLASPDMTSIQVIDFVFEDRSHDLAVVRALIALLRIGQPRGWRLRLVLPDQQVIEMLDGDANGGNGFRQSLEQIGTPFTYEYGTVWSTLGEQGDQLSVW